MKKESMAINQNLDDYIIPITGWSNNIESQSIGTLVGHFLIVAGHFIENVDKISFSIKNQKFKFNSKDALIVKTPSKVRKENDFDFCIFKIDEISSIFSLATELPNINEEVKNISFKYSVKKTNDDNTMTLFKNFNCIENWEKKINFGIVREYIGNFLRIEMTEPLEPGRSGSPIIIDDKIYGILVGGVGNGYMCAFQSSKSILSVFDFHF